MSDQHPSQPRFRLEVTYAAGHTQEHAGLDAQQIETGVGAFSRDLAYLEGRGITRLVAELEPAPNEADALIASARVLRVISDPEMVDGADPWLVGSTFDGDYSREHVSRIVAALIAEGMVRERDGLLFVVPHAEDEPS